MSVMASEKGERDRQLVLTVPRSVTVVLVWVVAIILTTAQRVILCQTLNGKRRSSAVFQEGEEEDGTSLHMHHGQGILIVVPVPT